MEWMTRRGIPVALAGLVAASISLAQTAKREITVAAAANLNQVFQTAGRDFEAASGIHPKFSFASTAQLTQQIENGAPFDVFAAADVEHVDQLEKKGMLTPGSRAIYATGILALWIPPSSAAKVNSIADLTQPSVKTIALANPDLAPYGLAARETLQHAGIWAEVQKKVVYADNISMARQFGVTGNVDAAFTAYSLLSTDKGKIIPVDEKLHTPINQALGIVKASPHQAEAWQFVEFLLRGKGREILASSGYRIPR